jgi:hypothetical protein
MRSIKSLSFESCLTDLHFLEASLLAEPTTEGLAMVVTETIDHGHALRLAALEAERGRVRAQARARRSDFQLDTGIGGLDREIRVEVPDDSSDTYNRIFTASVRHLTRFALRTQLDVSKKLRMALEASKLSDALKTKWRTQLLSLEAAGQTAVEAVEAADFVVFKGQGAVRDFKSDADAIRYTVYGTLMASAPAHVMARDWAESFFYVHDARTKAQDEDAPDAAPAVAPVAPVTPPPT